MICSFLELFIFMVLKLCLMIVCVLFVMLFGWLLLIYEYILMWLCIWLFSSVCMGML